MRVGILLGIAGCSDEWFLRGDKDTADEPADADSDADSDSDADTDSDADSDADSDSDTDTDTVPGDLDCDAEIPTPDPGAAGLGSCITEEVFCGDVIFGTLAGGSTIYDYEYWETVQELDALFGNYDAVDGPERVYAFRGLAQDEHVIFTVSTCFDLWADWIQYGDSDGDFCDLSPFNRAGVFEYGQGRTWWTDRTNQAPGTYDLEFVIEGLDGAEGNFKVTVDCY
jgi:hypothetical protein